MIMMVVTVKVQRQVELQAVQQVVQNHVMTVNLILLIMVVNAVILHGMNMVLTVRH